MALSLLPTLNLKALSTSTTTNRRRYTSHLLHHRHTNPLIRHLHPSPPPSFQRKTLPPCVAFATNGDTTEAKWYRVSPIKDLYPDSPTPFVLLNRGIVISLLKHEGEWIAFNEDSLICPYRWPPIQGCSGCSPSPSSDGRAVQLPRVCATRFPTWVSEDDVLYVWSSTKLPSVTPTDIMLEVPTVDHKEELLNERSTDDGPNPCCLYKGSSENSSANEVSMNQKSAINVPNLLEIPFVIDYMDSVRCFIIIILF
ncbi:putative pheophorbide a oxygenase [Helianthus debilis subsp. tardiflorus]